MSEKTVISRKAYRSSSLVLALFAAILVIIAILVITFIHHGSNQRIILTAIHETFAAESEKCNLTEFLKINKDSPTGTFALPENCQWKDDVHFQALQALQTELDKNKTALAEKESKIQELESQKKREEEIKEATPSTWEVEPGYQIEGNPSRHNVLVGGKFTGQDCNTSAFLRENSEIAQRDGWALYTNETINIPEECELNN